MGSSFLLGPLDRLFNMALNSPCTKIVGFGSYGSILQIDIDLFSKFEPKRTTPLGKIKSRF